MAQQAPSWTKLDDELMEALKQLIRSHSIPTDPKNADFDTIWKGLEGPHNGLSGEEGYRYWSIGEDSYHLHNELNRLKKGGTWAGAPGYVEGEVEKLLDRIHHLSEEEPPVRQPSEPIVRLVMYLLPLFTSLAALAVVAYYPNSAAIVLAGVVMTDFGFVGAVWSWRVRFAKYPGPRQVALLASFYVIGLNVVIILRFLGVIHAPGS